MNKAAINIDLSVVSIVLFLTAFGCLNIYSVDVEAAPIAMNFIKQCLWVGVSIVCCFGLNFLDTKIYIFVAVALYIFTISLLVLTVFWGKAVAGHSAWLQFAGIRLQPAEFTKFTTSLIVAYIISNTNAHSPSVLRKISIIFVLLLPVGIILLQGDVGSGLVFLSFAIAFYREGYFVMPILVSAYIGMVAILAMVVPLEYLSIGIMCGFIFVVSFFINKIKNVIAISFITIFTLGIAYGTDTVINKILRPHQKNRIEAWLSPDKDPRGIGWNVNQSKIAIGSGGFLGKGVFKGTQTKYGFVPEQHTDFIFCTIGEEHGWVGCIAVILLFIILICKLINIAERQRLQFARIYGYGLVGLILFHFTVNVGMTIGLMPVIGIPLPFMSYGGSSLLTFFVMTFILLKFDVERQEYARVSKPHFL